MSDLAPSDGRVVVVDAQLMFAQVVELALARHGYDVSSVDLSAAADPAELLLQVLADQPSVLVLDPALGPYGDGLELIQRAERGGVAVIVVTGSDDPNASERARAAGARRVLPKTSPLAELVETVDRLLASDPLPTPV